MHGCVLYVCGRAYTPSASLGGAHLILMNQDRGVINAEGVGLSLKVCYRTLEHSIDNTRALQQEIR